MPPVFVWMEIPPESGGILSGLNLSAVVQHRGGLDTGNIADLVYQCADILGANLENQVGRAIPDALGIQLVLRGVFFQQLQHRSFGFAPG